jgi:hypothetical protein
MLQAAVELDAAMEARCVGLITSLGKYCCTCSDGRSFRRSVSLLKTDLAAHNGGTDCSSHRRLQWETWRTVEVQAWCVVLA